MRHSGDLGDIISSLLVLRQIGGGRLVLAPHSGPHGPRENMTAGKAEWLIPLIAGQPYVTSVEYRDTFREEDVTHDMSRFRERAVFKTHENLALWHARSIGMRKLDFAPWLKAEPSPRTAGKIVVARSGRYHNPSFPWYEILRENAGRTAFIGTRDEYDDLRRVMHGMEMEHMHCENARMMAEFIAGSRLFVGNQSLPCWIAMAMGVPLVQETWPNDQNSRVIRQNAHFIVNRTDYMRMKMKRR